MPSGPLSRQAVTERLAGAGFPDAEEEAEELLAAAPDPDVLAAFLDRREQGEPLEWITGTDSFCGRPIRIHPGVYVPRAQTEDLARRAAAVLPAGGRAADLCTGSGAVASHLAAEVPTAAVVGVDLDSGAVACARANGVHAVRGDLGRPLRSGAFDVVVAVPPYVPTGELQYLPADVQRYEPRLALDGGADGLELVRRVVDAAARLLRPGGWLLVELGGEEDRLLAPALVAAGFAPAEPWVDDEGDLRGLATRLSPA